MFNTPPQRQDSENPRSRIIRGPHGRNVRIESARNPLHTVQRLLPYLGRSRITLVFVLLLVIGSSLLGLFGPYLIGVAVDDFIATGNAAGLAQMAALILLVFLLSNIFDAVAGWVMARLSQRALKDLRRDMFAQIQKLSLRFFDSNPAGELMSRLTNDIDAINQAVSLNLVALIASTLTLVGILVAMFVLNFWLAMASVVVVPLMFWFTNFIARYTRTGFRDLQKNLGELNAVMEEAISGQRVMRAFQRHQSAAETFRNHNQQVFHSAVRANSYALLLMPLTNQLGNLFVIVIAGLGGWLALRDMASVGVIITFITYGRNFINPLRQLANMYNSIQAALAGAERVFEIIDTPGEPHDDPQAAELTDIQGHVRFDNVSFGYRPDSPVIKEMSLEARPGETVALVGPTGAGKTTLMNLLTHFYEVDAGQISIDGLDLRKIRKNDLRRQLGLVLQDTFLFSGTVMENIRYGKLQASDEQVMHAARLAEADHFIRQLPEGYQTLLSERGSNLSQGQRQQLAIARAILADPGILVLDEATSSVDTRTEIRLQNALLHLMEGRTSFVIAHRLSTIRDADLLLVIRDGEIVEKGTHAELLSAGGFYHHLYLSQFKGEAI
jgi:ATP-binding cassette, subfamily B, multidrug efflux pump